MVPTIELQWRGHQVQNQSTVVIGYQQFCREETLRFDLLVDACLLVEVKAVEKVLSILRFNTPPLNPIRRTALGRY